ncbi:hypothetical protein [Streptomyces sp. NPDC048623]|uniref:LppU/SCO3897 family protein n=1 Tax=Streptomyces sp. NPDC048623 TaxID=3155761 RepID=UPI00342386B9
MTTPQPSDPFAAAPGQPAPQPEQPAQKKGGKLKAIIVFVVLLVVIGIVKVGVAYGARFGLDFLAGKTPVHAEVGDCVTVTGPDDKPKVDTQDCSSGKPDLFKVAQVHKGTFDLNKCDENKYGALAQQYGPDKFVLCLEEVSAK